MAWINNILDVTRALAAAPLLLAFLVFMAGFVHALPMGGLAGLAALILIAIGIVSAVAGESWPFIPIGAAGLLLGDVFWFEWGRRRGRAALQFWPWRQYAGRAERTERFLADCSWPGLVAARFWAPVRAFAPLLAGVLGQARPTFYASQVVSAVLLIAALVGIGSHFGESIQSRDDEQTRLIILLFCIALLLWLVNWCVGAALRHGPGLIDLLGARLASWGRMGETPIHRLAGSLGDPTRSEVMALLFGGAFLVCGIWLFLKILEDVVTGDSLVAFDRSVLDFLLTLHTPAATSILLAITELADTAVVAPIAVAGALLLVWRRARHSLCYWLAAIALASGFNTIVKNTVYRARPQGDLYQGLGEFSFPSGHTTVNVALYAFLAFLVARELPRQARSWVVLPLTWFAALIGVSRLYLGAHWFSDVAAGVVLSAVWVSLLGIAYERHRPPTNIGKPLFAVVLGTLVLAGTVNIMRHHDEDLARYELDKADFGYVQTAP